ncbi:TIGR02710 family CRISPR-associated protein [Tumebacillus algifaecis]|uniref:TIGR02710 family CRISPR-associated protein n=2 Tax=Tumebacillus algifaecis TaxID=1214604 RepID=A0A223CZD2_9BACL|nr:TIGR02710 family CRISPR-associated protein [Tumebacillus algifaecis]
MTERVLITTVGGSRVPIINAHRDMKPKYTVFITSKSRENQPSSSDSVKNDGSTSATRKPAKETFTAVTKYLLATSKEQNEMYLSESDLVAVGKHLLNEAGKSEQSILNQLQLQEDEYNIIELDSPDDISEAYSKITAQVQLMRQEYPHAEIVIDITGGTKSMSAAGALVANDEKVSLSVVVGKRPNLDKVDDFSRARFQNYGVVELRREVRRIQERLYGRDYPSAVELCQEVLQDVQNKHSKEVEQEQLVEKLEQLESYAKAFRLWDEFEHDAAVKTLEYLGEAALQLRLFGQEVAKAKRLMIGYYNDLTKPRVERVGFELAYDLYFNAVRRGEQQKFDDAVARLYRTLEVLGQLLLLNRHGIRTKWVLVAELEGKVSAEYYQAMQKKCNEQGVMETALMDSIKLLFEIDSNLRPFLKGNLKKLRGLLGSRNQSILAHGFTRVDEKVYQEFQEFVREFIVEVDGLVKNKPCLVNYEDRQFPREIIFQS